MGPSDHAGDSDNSRSVQHRSDITLLYCRNLDLLREDSDSERLWQRGDSDREIVSLSEFLGLTWGHPPSGITLIRT